MNYYNALRGAYHASRYVTRAYRNRRRPRRRPYRYTIPKYPSTQEVKVNDSFLETLVGNATGIILHFGGAAQGVGKEQRIGSVQSIRTLQLRLCVNATGTSVGQCYRVMLLWDYQPNKNVPAMADVLAGVTPFNARRFMELDNRDRFQIIMSKMIGIGANTNDNDNATLTFFCKCSSAVTTYSGPSAGVADITSGSLLVVLVSDNTATLDSAFFKLNLRVRFVDSKDKGLKSNFYAKKFGGNFMLR